MKSKIIGIFVLVILIVAAISIVPKVINGCISKYESDIAFIKAEAYPLRFVVTNRDETSLSGKYAFYTTDNEMVGEPYEFNMVGTEVFFDFLIADIENTKVVFPYLIFTDKIAPDNGINIAKQYAVDAFPGIFSKTLSDKFNKELIRVYKDICKGTKLEEQYGNAVHDTSELGKFIVGQEYRILTHSKGGIEIVPSDN